MSSWEITNESKTIPVLKNPALIEGLPGIGNVGKVAVDFLVEELKAKKLYSFFTHKFPYSVFVGTDNLIEMPKIELYYKQFDDSKKRDLLLLVGDIQPLDEISCYAFCEEILKVAKQFHCSEVVTTGGIGLQHIPEQPKVFCTGNDKSLFKEYAQKDLLVEQDIFGVVGPIVGVSGILLGLGKLRGVRGVALLAETFGNPMYLGIKGAQEILRVLDARFRLRLDLKKMNKEIIEVERELMKKTAEWVSEAAKATRSSSRMRGKEVSYIG